VTSYEFRKSSYSGPNGEQQECVEVARNLPHIVAIRDSKRPEGPILTVSADEWRVFQGGLLPSGRLTA